jgi:D123
MHCWRQLPRRSKVDEYAVEGVDYTEWSSDDEDDEAAVGIGQVIPSSLTQAYACVQHADLDHPCFVAQFQQFLEEVNAAIAQLGGKVLPKLNWSAPKVDLFMMLPYLGDTNGMALECGRSAKPVTVSCADLKLCGCRMQRG